MMFFHLFWLTAIWLFLTGELTAANLTLGLLLATGVLLLVTQRQPSAESTGEPTRKLRGGSNRGKLDWDSRRLYHALDLIAFFFWEVVVSGIHVALTVIRPNMRLRPAVVAIPVKEQTPAGVMVLANLITMTPGTLSLYADEDQQLLYVHTMQVDDVEEFRQTTQATFGRRVQEVVA
jgi:multicomponent Na+:H+ antiporter subunit E